MEVGARTVLSMPFGPFRFRWTADHVDYEPNRLFRDVQARGPFAKWDHLHLFEPVGSRLSVVDVSGQGQVVTSMAMRIGSAEAEIAKPLSILALPDGSGCSFYGAALAELLRVLTGFEGAMNHERCRGRGDNSCVWRATAVGGYE